MLHNVSAPEQTLIAMVDGDGDRLALYTTRSGYIGSAEQAAAVLQAGLPVQQLITTSVAPVMTIRSACRHQPDIGITQTPVGFKHIVSAWKQAPHAPSLGLEPNGALVWTANSHGYFERDSLAALVTVLARFSTSTDLDDAIANLRRHHPHPQQIITVSQPVLEVTDRLYHLLPEWHSDSTGNDLVVFDDGGHGRIAIRASGTEPGTRLYIEAPPEATVRLITALT